MSQTLNLDLGSTYEIFVTPPVYGTDFTGVPQPTIAYQWKRNGVSLLGKTTNSLSGVVAGDTPDVDVNLLNGDALSVDITLTNAVSTALLSVSATINTLVPVPRLQPVSIRRQVGGNWIIVSSLQNSDVGVVVRPATNVAGTIETTPAGATFSYQWRRGFSPIAGATSADYTISAADENSILDCVVVATNASGSVSRTATMVVGVVPSLGFTELTPSSDSRLVYVSNDGDDVAAKAVKGGRGYYLPSDPEIGPDPLNPVGPIVAYATPREGFKKIRCTGWVETNAQGQEIVAYATREERSASGGGFPDWLLYRRGDTFVRGQDYQSPGWGLLSGELGSMMKVGWGDNIDGGAFRFEAGFPSGRSVSEPLVISAWGPPTSPRPIIHGGFTVEPALRNAVVASLDIQVSPDPLLPGNRTGLNFVNAGESVYGSWRNVLIEDCRSQGHAMIFMSGGGPSVNLTLRRCVYSDGWNPAGHNSSPYNGLKVGSRLTIEECVFDRNGYKENPADATKWTGNFVSALSPGGTGDPGTGVQPTRSWFDRNWYMSGAAGDTLVVRGNIAARTGGGAEQLRSGGVAERNLFLFEHDGMLMGSGQDEYGVQDSLLKQNVFLHDDLMVPPGGWGLQNYFQGGRAAVVDNVFTHPHRGQNGPGTFFFWQVKNYESSVKAFLDNAYYARIGRGFTTQRSGESFDHPSMTIVGNKIAVETPTGYGLGAISRSSKSASDTVDGNLYLGDPNAIRFLVNYTGGAGFVLAGNRTFLQWQADGYDTTSQMIADWSAFKSAAGWSAPERDIVSYMQSIDPTYVPDEDVRVDYGASVGRADAPLVRTVILGSAFGQIAEDANARLAARRFHAAVTFLLRARENRKHAWDDRYTAEAVCNYIRGGYGKSTVTGAYDTRDIATRMQEHL